MCSIPVTLEVSQPERSKETRDEQPANMRLMSSTFDVSRPVTSASFSSLQPLNQFLQSMQLPHSASTRHVPSNLTALIYGFIELQGMPRAVCPSADPFVGLTIRHPALSIIHSQVPQESQSTIGSTSDATAIPISLSSAPERTPVSAANAAALPEPATTSAPSAQATPPATGSERTRAAAQALMVTERPRELPISHQPLSRSKILAALKKLGAAAWKKIYAPNSQFHEPSATGNPPATKSTRHEIRPIAQSARQGIRPQQITHPSRNPSVGAGAPLDPTALADD